MPRAAILSSWTEATGEVSANPHGHEILYMDALGIDISKFHPQRPASATIPGATSFGSEVHQYPCVAN
eukprot:3685837-Pyramimonas_sp.AAC.1